MSDAKGPGSSSNMVAGLASFFCPGLGQLLQGRIGTAALFFIGAFTLYWFFFLGALIHLWSIIDAARWRGD